MTLGNFFIFQSKTRSVQIKFPHQDSHNIYQKFPQYLSLAAVKTALMSDDSSGTGSISNNNNNSPPNASTRRPTGPLLKFGYILNRVGDDGRHQKWLLYGFLLPLAFYIPFGSSSLVLMLSTPEHHCMVPAREQLNVSRALWRRVTIPW